MVIERTSLDTSCAGLWLAKHQWEGRREVLWATLVVWMIRRRMGVTVIMGNT